MDLTPDVNCKYGAPMGRREWGPRDPDYEGVFYLQHISLDSGGYDKGGAYWGIGSRLYGYASTDDEINGFVRAFDRAAAKSIIRVTYPKVKFFDEKRV
jgi:hypothetical protein